MKVISICGARNHKGQTARACEAVLKGVTTAGGFIEQIFLPALKLEHCRQCNDDGWGSCRKEGRCIIDDDFADLLGKIRKADAVVFSTPVYYGDLSESFKAFSDRLRRICTQDSGRKAIKDKHAIGICVAGGGGGGAPNCCVSMEKVISICGFEVVDMIPVRRQNLNHEGHEAHATLYALLELRRVK